MAGFVGSRAKKRSRNIFLSLVFFIIIVILFFFLPNLEDYNSKIVPNDNIIPDPSEDMTSLASNIEELELNLFQKEQKIKFRDGQITNLQNNLKETKSQYDSVTLELIDVKNELNLLSSNNKKLIKSDKFISLQDKFAKLSIENNNNISKIKSLNKQINDLNKNLQSTEDIINENQKLKNEKKNFFAQKIKLNNNIDELKQKIIEQTIEIKSNLEKIKKLEDKSHHGG